MKAENSKQPNKPALGKGLASLLPGAANNPALKAKHLMGNIPPVEKPAEKPAPAPRGARKVEAPEEKPAEKAAAKAAAPAPAKAAPASAPAAPAPVAARAPEPAAEAPAPAAVAAPAPAAAAPVTARTPAPAVQNKDRIAGITMAETDSIVANQFQPRRDFDDNTLTELAESIRANGIIQPLITRRGEDGKLHLIAGERRLRASKLAGLKQVPVVIRMSTDKEALELALIENVQREDLNCVDVALSYFQLSEDFQLTQEEIAKRVGKDRVSVANHLRLLKLPESIIQDLRTAKLSYGHGRALLSVTDPLKRLEIRNMVVEKHLSVRDTERLVAEAMMHDEKAQEKRKKKENNQPLELKHFGERLGRALGTRVKTKGDQYRGTIVIDYFSKEDLDRISDQLLR
jgi:ParB family chromosome partitioning protein